MMQVFMGYRTNNIHFSVSESRVPPQMAYHVFSDKDGHWMVYHIFRHNSITDIHCGVCIYNIHRHYHDV